MKKLLLFTPILLTVISAQADVVIIQKMESPIMSGDVTMKIKGDKSRVDLPAGPAGAMSMIIDGTTGDMSTMMHAQKMVMKMDSKTLKQATEQAKKSLGDAAPTKPKATGKTEKVGDWDTEIFEVSVGGMSSKIWVAKSFPNYEKVKAEMVKVSKVMGQNPADAAAMDVPGMPVKQEVTLPGGQGKMVTTLTKAVEEAVDAKEFEVPKDYQAMNLPTAPK